MQQETIRMCIAALTTQAHVTAFAVYYLQTKTKDTKPNTSTWTIWAVITAMNFGAYFRSSGDPVASAMPAVSSVACLIMFAASLRNGAFKRPSAWDAVTMCVGIVAGLVWWRFNTPFVADIVMRLAPSGASAALVANVILQFAVGISFIPTYRDAWTKRSEQPHAWALWGLAYAMQILVVYLRTDEKQMDFLYPVQGLLMHSAVVPIALLARRHA